MDNNELYNQIREFLVSQFEIPRSEISLDANLYEELDIDSIDAVDLMVQIKELTGKKIPPEQFREVRTLRDLLTTISAQ
jgi:acyl carrier protein